MIVIKRVYSWFNVYVDNVLVLTHISEEGVLEILKSVIKSDYKIAFRCNSM